MLQPCLQGDREITRDALKIKAREVYCAIQLEIIWEHKETNQLRERDARVLVNSQTNSNIQSIVKLISQGGVK